MINKIVINGVARSGKDTFVNLARYYLKDKTIYNISTVQEVREFCQDMLGIPFYDKSDLARALWHKTKMKYRDWIFWSITKNIDTMERCTGDNIVWFIHSREPEDIQAYKNKYGETLVSLLIKRDNLSIPNNKADKGVFDYDYDVVIENNDDIVDFDKEVKVFVDKYLIK